MKLIAFSKHFVGRTAEQLITLGHELGLDGWDLCVRPKHPVNPENAAQKLPEVARLMAAEGLSIPMITADLLYPDDPRAVPILSAMDKAGVRYMKFGYYKFDPLTQDFWVEIDKIRRAWEGWQKLARQYHVTLCYHTHSKRLFGTCGAQTHMLRGFDPKCLGAFLDPAHLVVEGEEFSYGLAMIKDYLALVALKDIMLTRAPRNEDGSVKPHNDVFAGVMLHYETLAGEGLVDWPTVFADLNRVGFDGPMTVHCEFAAPDDPTLVPKAKREVAFFRKQVSKYWPRP